MTRHSIPRPTAQKISTQSDLVFCIDATGSMQPCFAGVRDGLLQLIDGLQSEANVNYRLRLIAYRDYHDERCNTPWDETAFTDSADIFRGWMTNVRAGGGGENHGSESTLDAIYKGIHSEWRTTKTHKTIVVMTDHDTHPTIHPRTYSAKCPGDNGVDRIIQDLQTERHAMLFMIAPRFPIYEQIEMGMKNAGRQVMMHWVPYADVDERYQGLAAVKWGPLMQMIGKIVSATSVVVAHEH